MTKHFKFRTRGSNPASPRLYTVDIRGERVRLVNPEGSELGGSYKVSDIERYVETGQWVVVEDLELAGVDADGNIIKFGTEDIMDFMRVLTADGLFIVYTNARVDGLPKYITNGKDKPRRLDFSAVLAVYSQPEGSSMLDATVGGKLRFKRADVVKLTALQDAVAKAEAALAAAKAALVAGK